VKVLRVRGAELLVAVAAVVVAVVDEPDVVGDPMEATLPARRRLRRMRVSSTPLRFCL